MNLLVAIAGAVIIITGIFLSDTFFTVHEVEQALILQFGEPKRVIKTPGLKFKIPFIQNVVIVDRRVLDIDPPIEQVILADQKRLDVDAFARYRITDPLLFFQSVGSEAVVEQRLKSVVNSSLRRVLGSVTLLTILSEERAGVMENIREQVNVEAQKFGIEIVDVRVRRADFPETTSQAIFARMRSERERAAAEAVLRGQGDQQALQIIADATSRDPEFFAFYRSLQAYRTVIQDNNTTFILSPTGEFFQYFKHIIPLEPHQALGADQALGVDDVDGVDQALEPDETQPLDPDGVEPDKIQLLDPDGVEPEEGEP